MNLDRLIERHHITHHILSDINLPDEGGYPAFPRQIKFTMMRIADDGVQPIFGGTAILSQDTYGPITTELILRSLLELIDDVELEDLREPYATTINDFLSWFDDIDPRDTDGDDMTLRDFMSLGETTSQWNGARDVYRIDGIYDVEYQHHNGTEYLIVPNAYHGLHCSHIDEANYAWMRQNVEESVVISNGPYLSSIGIPLDEEIARDRIENIAKILRNLLDYPIIDESFYSDYEYTEQMRQWNDFARDEFIRALVKAHNDRFGDDTIDLDDISDEQANALMQTAIAEETIVVEAEGDSFTYDNITNYATMWAFNLDAPLVHQE